MKATALMNNLHELAQAALAHHATLPADMSAYLLLEDSADTALGDLIASAKAEKRWHPVPDPYFATEPDSAPVLIALDLREPDAQAAFNDALVLAINQAPSRLQAQRVGALLWSAAPVDELLAHFAVLGSLRSPQGESVVYRFQDPRVLQWLWLTFKDLQKLQWLGPIEHWWAVTQPSGPWSEETQAACQAQWWAMARDPRPPAVVSPLDRRLLNAAQWFTAHTAASANRVWNTLYVMAVEGVNQPGTTQMRAWLSEANKLGLDLRRVEGYALVRAYAEMLGQGATWGQAPNQTWVREALTACAENSQALFDNQYLSLRKRAGQPLF